LVAEALERLGPALRELSPDGLRLQARALGPPGRRRGREAARLAELGADPRHELRTRGHRGVSLSSSLQRSRKVRLATAGRSRVRVTSAKSGRRSIEPSRTTPAWS